MYPLVLVELLISSASFARGQVKGGTSRAIYFYLWLPGGQEGLTIRDVSRRPKSDWADGRMTFTKRIN